MKSSIIVVDNFYIDPEDVRNFALNSEFSVLGNYPGRRTGPFLHQGIKDAIQRTVQRPIVFWPENTYNGAFQYTAEQDCTWVHSDYTTNYAGILYLTPDPPIHSGTAFFRHMATGLDYYPSDPDLRKICDRDAPDFPKWIQTDIVANVFNRLVLFDADRFHAGVGYFGKHLKLSLIHI